MLSVHSEKPICLPPHLRSFPALSLKWFHCLCDWWWTFLVLSVKIVTVLLFPPLSPPGGGWCHSLTLSTPLSSRWWMVSQSYSFHPSLLQVVDGVTVLLFPPLSPPGGGWCQSYGVTVLLFPPLSPPPPGGGWCQSYSFHPSLLQVVDGVSLTLSTPLSSRWWMVSVLLFPPLSPPGGGWCHSLTLSTPLSSRWWMVSQSYSFHPSLLQVVDGVMPLALCLHAVYLPRH